MKKERATAHFLFLREGLDGTFFHYTKTLQNGTRFRDVKDYPIELIVCCWYNHYHQAETNFTM
jgi:hypothetical protein